MGHGGDARLEQAEVYQAISVAYRDMDASPLFPRYEIPLTGRSRIGGDAALGARKVSKAVVSAGPPLAGGISAKSTGERPSSRCTSKAIPTSPSGSRT